MPNISIVMTSRNDDHGGNFLNCMRLSIDTLAQLSKKYNLAIELIIVEWNPPQDKFDLKDALELNSINIPALLRFIGVPRELHNRFPKSEEFPLFQYIAKNVGIRRANSEYVISTNADIIFSEELFCYLKKQKLDKNCFYRVDRYDVPSSVPLTSTMEERLTYCRQQIEKKCGYYGTYESSHSNSLINFFRMVENSLKRMRAKIVGTIHTYAAGDFMLMSKKHWDFLRGYPEIPSHAYVDGLICYMAASIGLKQIVLEPRACVYHVMHEFQWNRMNETQRLIYRANIDYGVYRDCCLQMLRNRKPLLVNDLNWGLGNEILREY